MRSGSEREAEYSCCLDATQPLLFRRRVTCVIEQLAIRTKVAGHDNGKAFHDDQARYPGVHIARCGHPAWSWWRDLVSVTTGRISDSRSSGALADLGQKTRTQEAACMVCCSDH